MCMMSNATASGWWREDCSRDLGRRSDYVTAAAEATLELLAEPAKELDVLRLLACKREERPDSHFVVVEQRAGVVEHERQDELLDQAEYVEVAVALGSD